MPVRSAPRLLFILYCLETGAFLLVAPWVPSWDRSVLQLSFAMVPDLLLHPLLCGGVSGFGLVHLVWGLHDFQLWLDERRLRGRTTS